MDHVSETKVVDIVVIMVAMNRFACLSTLAKMIMQQWEYATLPVYHRILHGLTIGAQPHTRPLCL